MRFAEFVEEPGVIDNRLPDDRSVRFSVGHLLVWTFVVGALLAYVRYFDYAIVPAMMWASLFYLLAGSVVAAIFFIANQRDG